MRFVASKSPFLLEPAQIRPRRGVEEIVVGQHVLGQQADSGRVEHAGFDVLFVELLEPQVGIAEGRVRVHPLVGAGLTGAFLDSLEQLLERARVRHLAVVPVALAGVAVELEQRLAVLHDDAQGAVLVLVLDVAGVAVLTFGQVLIGVEDAVLGERLVLEVLRRHFAWAESVSVLNCCCSMCLLLRLVGEFR